MKLQDIKDFVDSEFQIDINKNTRQTKYIEARCLYYKLAKDYTNLSLKEIGSLLNKHHATVIHSIDHVWHNAIKYNRWVRESYCKFNKIAEKEDVGDQDIYSLQLKLIEAKEEIFRLKSINHEEFMDKYYSLEKDYNKLQEDMRLISKENQRFSDLISQLDDERKRDELFFKLEAAVKLLKNAVYI